MNNPKIIGIRFSDNDFFTTVIKFLTILHETGIDNYEELTKEKIVDLFNKSALGIYYLCQNRLTYDTRMPDTYLTIQVKHVFFDDEVEKHIEENNGNDNGEFFILDTENYKSYVYNV